MGWTVGYPAAKIASPRLLPRPNFTGTSLPGLIRLSPAAIGEATAPNGNGARLLCPKFQRLAWVLSTVIVPSPVALSTARPATHGSGLATPVCAHGAMTAPSRNASRLSMPVAGTSEESTVNTRLNGLAAEAALLAVMLNWLPTKAKSVGAESTPSGSTIEIEFATGLVIAAPAGSPAVVPPPVEAVSPGSSTAVRVTSAESNPKTWSLLGSVPAACAALCSATSPSPVVTGHGESQVSPGWRKSGGPSVCLSGVPGAPPSQDASATATPDIGWVPRLVTVSVNGSVAPAVPVAGPVISRWMVVGAGAQWGAKSVVPSGGASPSGC